MKAALAMLALCCVGLQAAAFEICADRDKRKAFDREARTLRKALPERRFDDLERHFGDRLAAMDKGKLNDAAADREFAIFEARDLGDCAACGSRDPAPLLREWVRRHPKSPAAWLAVSYHYAGLGFAMRGDKPLAQTAPAGIESMHAAFREALAALEEAQKTGRGEALVAAQRLRIAAADPRAAGGTPTELYRRALQSRPNSIVARVRYAEASQPRWSGSIKQIESVMADARTLAPADQAFVRYASHQMMGRAAEVAGDNAAAARNYAASVAACPGLYNAGARLADLYLRTGKHKEAVVAASRIVEGDSADGWARTLRGKAYRALGRHREAYADFESATELGYRAAFEELAWFHETGTLVPRDLRKALELYAIAEDGDIATARASAARLRTALGGKR